MTEPTTTTTSSSTPQPKSWIELINESVHTADDINIGDIDAISRDFIVVKRGFVNVHHYYIPIIKAEGWDGNVLWLKITETEVKEKYERDKTPDPLEYYVKDYAYYSSLHYPELTTIPLRYTRPTFTVPSPPSSEVPHIYIFYLTKSIKELVAHEEQLQYDFFSDIGYNGIGCQK